VRINQNKAQVFKRSADKFSKRNEKQKGKKMSNKAVVRVLDELTEMLCEGVSIQNIIEAVKIITEDFKDVANDPRLVDMAIGKLDEAIQAMSKAEH